MPSWITIYLQNFVSEMDAETIRNSVSDADWGTLGEHFEIDEEDVTIFIENLQWRNNPLEIGQVGLRPIQIHLYNNAEDIKEELEELTTYPLTVGNHLKDIKTIVALELSTSQLETMFEIVAFEVAYWLAQTNRGLIQAPDSVWYDHDEHRWDPIE